MPSDARVAAIEIRVDGSDLADLEYAVLYEARVEQSLHVPDAVSLRFIDPSFELFDGGKFDVGAEMSVALDAGSGPAVVANAEVTAVSIAPGLGGRHELTVTALDQGHRLAREVKRRTFSQQSDSEIASTIASDHQLSADVDATTTTYPYLVQAESDYALLSRRAVLAGYRWWVSDGRLHFKKPSDEGVGPTLTWGENLYDFRARFTAAESTGEVEVRGWDSENQEAIVGTATPERSGLEAIGSTAAAAADLVKAANEAYPAKRYVAMAVQDADEATTIAKAMALRATAGEVVARGEASGDPNIRAGQRIDIDEVGERLSGSYLLTSVEHVVSGGRPYITRFTAGAADASQLADLLRAPTPVATSWSGAVPVIGVVTNIADDEQPGRIRVRFPSLSDEEESEWVRVVAPGAGLDRGWQFSHEVDDEVLVVFEHGDPRRPLALGGLWSTKNKHPMAPADAVKDGTGVAGVFQTRSGHRIEMHEGDEAADQYITIALSDEKTTLTLSAEGVKLTGPKDISIESAASLKLTADKDISLEADKITLSGKSKVAIDSADFSASGSQQASVTGGSAELKGDMSAKVEGGSMTEVKGGMVKIN